MEIVFATWNGGKLLEMKAMLGEAGVLVRGLSEFEGAGEIDETGSSFVENARQKAVHFSQELGCWALGDDSGLVVDALGGEPGIYSARYSGVEGVSGSERDAANIRKVLSGLLGVEETKRTGRFYCCLCLCRSDGEVEVEVEGRLEGRITTEIKGEEGFGYDPIFYVRHLGKTVAQLSSREKNAISHRGEAVRGLIKSLETGLTGW